MNCMQEEAPPDLASLSSTLEACSQHDATIRSPAEERLKRWESSMPHVYLCSLLNLLQSGGGSEQLRLFTAILIKNAVPIVWSLSSTSTTDASSNSSSSNSSSGEGSVKGSFSKEERGSVRVQIGTLLFSEANDRIALQLRLGVSRICCFDYPREWPGVLSDLMQMASGQGMQQTSSDAQRLRAVKCVRDVLQSAKSRKIVIEQPAGGAGGAGMHIFMSIRKAMQQAALQQQEAQQNASAILPGLVQGIFQHATAFFANTAESPQVLFEGTMCVGYLKALRELLTLVTRPSHQFQTELQPFLTQLPGLLDQVKHYNLLPEPKPQRIKISDQIYRHTLHASIATMETLPLLFAPCVPPILQMILQTSIIGMDQTTLRSLPMKRVVAQTRLVIAVLAKMEYDPEAEANLKKKSLFGLMARLEGRMLQPNNDNNDDDKQHNDTKTNQNPALQQTQQIVSAVTTSTSQGGLCETLVQALVTKYLCLSPDEVQEWDDDPESRFQTDEAERLPGAEAEQPRHCGGMVLAHMMERQPLNVGRALLELAQSCQALPPTDVNGLIGREACYRALQLCRGGMLAQAKALNFHFATWWEGELRLVLQTPLSITQHPVPMRMLQARVIQVLQAYAMSLPEAEYATAFVSVAQLLAAEDLVTALCAARCTHHLALLHFKEKEVTPQLTVVREHSVMALGHAFALAHRVTTEECLRTVLMLVSGLVEANGTTLQSCLHAIAEQLPPLWERAGDSVPIHSCLMSVLNHLIAKLGAMAVEHAQVQKVLFPLLDYCTDVSVMHRADTLLEDGLKLWLVVLVTSRISHMGNSLQSMVPRLEAVLRTGLEAHLSLKVLQFYAVLFGPSVLQPLAGVLKPLLMDCTTCVTDIKDGKDGTEGKEQEMTDDSNSTTATTAAATTKAGTIKDGIAALNFCAILLQLFPDLAYDLCLPAVTTVLQALPKSAFPYALVDAAFTTLGRLLWHAPTFLEQLYAGDPEEEKHLQFLVTSWLDLVSHPPIMRVLTPGLLFLDQKGAALALCAAVCQSPKVRRIGGKDVLKFVTALQDAEQNTKLKIEDLVEGACGTTRQVTGDGPLGDSAERTREILKSDPILTTQLKEAVEKVRNVLDT